MLQSAPDKILLIKLRALGDVILSTPVVWNLRQAFPQAQIAFLTEEAGAEVLKNDPVLNEVVVYPRQAMESKRRVHRIGEEREFLSRLKVRKYNWVIDLFGNPRSAWLTYLSGARKRVGFAYHFRKWAYNVKVPPKNPQYVVEFNLDALRALGVPVVDSRLKVYPSDEDRAFAEQYWKSERFEERKLVVGLFPGGGWESKRWGLKGFAEVGDTLSREYGAGILLLGGEKEKKDLQEIAGEMKSKPKTFVEATLGQLAAVSAKLSLWIGNDSGPKYFAVAFDVPTVTIFGPTDSANATPPGGRHLAVAANVPCLVCNQTTCPFKLEDERHQQCMRKVSPEQVLEAAKRLLNGR